MLIKDPNKLFSNSPKIMNFDWSKTKKYMIPKILLYTWQITCTSEKNRADGMSQEQTSCL